MSSCPACGRELPGDSRFCPACGVAVAAAVPTGPFHPGPTEVPTVSAVGETTDRFSPGTLLGGRFRIVAVLGKGGMGEVYRADDLKLGQSVALKFLPANLVNDADRLRRFHHEVRISRHVSHPHVCRVYDIGEVDGQSFLTMEFIDGQDLASLLRQVGRLPEDRGVELARQLCQGLAAAHDKGIVHRDLKPHNIMIDGRGHVRITDFGLAAYTEDLQKTEISHGTPAYMAPEQLAGKEISRQSDLYALGLVLYEIFTGRRAFPAQSREELIRFQEDSTPSKPSSHVSGLNPAVDRVILRCLEKDPRDRPRSALEVLAGLPGGDPLAAALAAGETPSPQLVASAGGEGTLAPHLGVALVGLALVGIVLSAWLNDRLALFSRVRLEQSPRELARKAQAILVQLGYGQEDRFWDRAFAFSTDEDFLQHGQRAEVAPQVWSNPAQARPPLMYFWYRESPMRMVQRLTPNDATGWGMPGRVTPNEPPLTEPGMRCLFLDPRGQLIEFHAVPPRSSHSPNPNPGGKVDWSPLLQAAGLDKAPLVAVPPGQLRRTPPVYADARMGWDLQGPEGLPIRVEAAACQGRVVYFHLGVPYYYSKEEKPFLPSERVTVGTVPDEPQALSIETLYGAVGLAVLTVGPWLAWQHWRRGRANPRGALWLAAFFFATAMVGWLLTAKHVPAPYDEAALLAGMAGRVLLDTVVLGLAYLALEPFVRRRTPWRIISWNRLLEGRWRDPLVGRDILIGCAFGVTYAVLTLLIRLVPEWLGWPPGPRSIWDVSFTEGAGDILLLQQYALMMALRDFFLFFAVYLLCRREWLAAILVFVVVVPLLVSSANKPWIEGLVYGSYYALGLFLLLRFGLLAYTVFALHRALFPNLPLTLDFAAWYAGTAAITMLLSAGLAVHGFWLSRADRPLLRAGWFE